MATSSSVEEGSQTWYPVHDGDVNSLNAFRFAIYTSQGVQFVFGSLFNCQFICSTINIPLELTDFRESLEELGSTYFLRRVILIPMPGPLT